MGRRPTKRDFVVEDGEHLRVRFVFVVDCLFQECRVILPPQTQFDDQKTRAFDVALPRRVRRQLVGEEGTAKQTNEVSA